MASRYTSHQQSRERTALFDEPKRISSPYEKSSKDFRESELSSMEAQSSEEANLMMDKIRALKGLSVKMGEEIRGSNKTLDELGNTFEHLGQQLKGTFKKMMVMAQRSGIPLKTWALFFVLILLFFFWVWFT